QTQSNMVLEGLLTQNESGGEQVVARIFDNPKTPKAEQTMNFLPNGVFGVIRGLIDMLVEQAGGELPSDLSEDINLFGTEDPAAYLDFLRGYDDLQYVERSQGNVLSEFNPEETINNLISAVEADKDWEAPFL